MTPERRRQLLAASRLGRAVAGFAGPAGEKGDLDPDGHWRTVSGNAIHIDSNGEIDAGGHPALRQILAEKAGLHPRGTKAGGGDADDDGIDWVRVVPFIGMHLMCFGVFFTGVSPIALWTALALYALRMFAITAFYHRYFSHRTFRTHRVVQFFAALMMMGLGFFLGTVGIDPSSNEQRYTFGLPVNAPLVYNSILYQGKLPYDPFRDLVPVSFLAATPNVCVVPTSLAKRESAFCSLRLVDADDCDVPVGTPGEAALRGPTLFSGYWNAPEVNAHDFRGGWFHMGDLFVRRADGSLDFVDRAKYLIKSGGENIYPAEVERVLALGARRVDIGQGEESWVVLADPDGNAFCVAAGH